MRIIDQLSEIHQSTGEQITRVQNALNAGVDEAALDRILDRIDAVMAETKSILDELEKK